MTCPATGPVDVGAKVGARVPTAAYVHFPWCERRCPYCDFATVGIDRRDIPQQEYADEVKREIDRGAPKWQTRHLVSVFFGGGTPSLWDAPALGSVLDHIKSYFGSKAEALEVTVECNPASLNQQKAAELRAVGVNRLSVGVQSLSDDELSFLGRLHQGEGALRAIGEARREVSSVSADLMFGVSHRSPREFKRDVARLISLDIDHLSAYALTIEPGTQFGALHRRGRLPIASEDEFRGVYLAAEAFLKTHGFNHYEVSNYGRPGRASIHNQHYWAGGDYAGFGAGAVGCLSDPQQPGKALRHRNAAPGNLYLQGRLDRQEEPLDQEALIREAWMLGLRTSKGMSCSATAARLGRDPAEGRLRAIQRQQERGNLTFQDGHFRVPSSRWLYLDGILADLF